MLDEALRFFDYHFGYLDVPGSRFVEGRADDLAAYRALHVSDFFGALVDEQNDQVDLRMVRRDGVRDALQHHGFTRARRSDDQPALAFSERRQQIHHADGEVILARLQLQPLVRVERRQVVEENLVPRFLRWFEVDRVYFDECEVALAFFRRTNLAGDCVTGTQIEAAD